MYESYGKVIVMVIPGETFQKFHNIVERLITSCYILACRDCRAVENMARGPVEYDHGGMILHAKQSAPFEAHTANTYCR